MPLKDCHALDVRRIKIYATACITIMIAVITSSYFVLNLFVIEQATKVMALGFVGFTCMVLAFCLSARDFYFKKEYLQRKKTFTAYNLDVQDTDSVKDCP